MEKKNKINIKVFLTSLIAVCSLVFAIGCGKTSDSSAQKSAGKGTLKLQIKGATQTGGYSAMTIMPTKGDFAFDKYNVTCTPYDGNTLKTSDAETKSFTSTNISLTLNGGDYKLYVTAEIGGKIVAKGELGELPTNKITIPEGNSLVRTIYLKAIDDDGNGTFAWNISYPALQSGNMKIVGDSTDQTVTFTGTSNNNISTPLTLSAGQYSVTITLQQSGSKQIVWYETLYIYQNMTSTFVKVFDAQHFLKEIYTVTLNYGYGSPVQKSYLHGSISYAESNPVRDGFTFTGWYKALSDTLPFIDPGDPIPALTGNLVLYAKWEGAPELTAPSEVKVTMNYGPPPYLPYSETIQIKNIGEGAATISSITFTGETTVYDESHPANGTQIAANGGSEYITIQPSDTFKNYYDIPSGIETHSATYTVTYDGGRKINIKVTLTVYRLEADTIPSQFVFDSRQLLTFDPTASSVQGWWTKTISGEWVYGQMQEGEGTLQFEFKDLGGKAITYTGQFATNSPYDLAGGIGKLYIYETCNGSPKCFSLELVLNIPHSSVRIRILNGSATVILKDDSNKDITNESGGIVIDGYTGSWKMVSGGGSGTSVLFEFEIETDIGWVYVPEFLPGDIPNPAIISAEPRYPIFKQSGVDIYFWNKDYTDLTKTYRGDGNWVFNHDMPIYFHTYAPKALGQGGSIIVNLADAYALGGEALGGMDWLPSDSIYPYWMNYHDFDFNSWNIDTLDVHDIYFGGMKVGTATVKLTDINPKPTAISLNPTSVDYTVTYDLDELYVLVNTLSELQCNGLSQYAPFGNINKIVFTFTGQPHGPTVVNTGFVFP
ncbi:MAG: InlB B-repeat-containing protein [Leptospirales bacterium]|nr:InlB B-repeat-containing protein [Leptospirales bacterium]